MIKIYGSKPKINKKNLFRAKSSLIIFGSQSESFSDFYDLANEMNLQPICVDNLDEMINSPTHKSIHYKNLESFHFSMPTVISVISPEKRVKAMRHAMELGFYDFPAYINPNSDISKSAQFGRGGFINSLAIIGSNVVLSNFVTINKGANISHDVTIGEFSHIAPSACILGSVNIGSNVTIGANATILPKLWIGDGALVGAGSVVTHDVLPGQIVYGNPARAK
jgi:acetyltransferase-like isoleucine patch superfamily enzyme